MKMAKTGGWQEFKFEPVTAKYFTLKMTADNQLIAYQRTGNNGIEILGNVKP
jgi:hypothetical protein